MTIPAPDIFVRIYARHGHRCPMSTLGGRIGLAARRLLGEGRMGVTAEYLTRTCAVDGIAEAAGLDEGDGSLLVVPEGKHLLRLEHSEGMLEIELSSTAMQLAGTYRRLGYELEAGWNDLDAAERTRREALRGAALDELLPRLWTMDDAELLVIREESYG